MRLTSTHRDAFVRAVLADVPSVDYDEQMRAIMLEESILALPPAVQKMARDNTLKGYLCMDYFYSNSSGIPCASIYGHCRDFQLSATAGQKLGELAKLKQEQREKLKALEEKLKGVINACSTRKVAVERLPEFEKYLPSDLGAKTSSVPALANLVTDLVAAGWPKDKKVAA
jgi:hypothetical protein